MSERFETHHLHHFWHNKLFSTKKFKFYWITYINICFLIFNHSIIIGAPRAQSDILQQRAINETGALYKCTIEPINCNPYILDELGNIVDESRGDTYNNENKDYQWLGGAIDGSSSENERFVVKILTFLFNSLK